MRTHLGVTSGGYLSLGLCRSQRQILQLASEYSIHKSQIATLDSKLVDGWPGLSGT